MSRGVIKDLTGQRFGRLVVLAITDERVDRRAVWRCRCDCGTLCRATSSGLLSGKKKSCGCFMREAAAKSRSTHHMSGRPLYVVWQGMVKRCTYKRHKNFADYGGRGIKICDEWRQDFAAFYAWAMANGYKDGLTIDRIDVNGNYCPENCRWVTHRAQCNNKRNNRLLTCGGKTCTMAEWAEFTGINLYTLNSRINQLDWSVERALTTPVQKRRQNTTDLMG